MKKEKTIISVLGDEANRSEVVYNNIFSNLKLSEKEQISYLREKVILAELKKKNNIKTFFVLIISLILTIFGCYLLVSDLYLMGFLLIIFVVIFSIAKNFTDYRKNLKDNTTSKYERVEHLRKLLDSRIR